MKNIEIVENDIMINISNNNEISRESEYAIKALAGLQIMLIRKNRKEDEKLEKALNIIMGSLSVKAIILNRFCSTGCILTL